MSLWNLITDASTLPVQTGNTLWDHLNNLNAGGIISHIYLAKSFNLNLERTVLNAKVNPKQNLTVKTCSVVLLSRQVTNLDIERIEIP